MRHGYGGKYLKELHKSALYQGQGFGKDASKFGKGTFYLLCSGSNQSILLCLSPVSGGPECLCQQHSVIFFVIRACLVH